VLSGAIRCNHAPSGAIRRHQAPSGAIRRHQVLSGARAPSGAIMRHQVQSGAIRCHQQVPRPIVESALARSASAAGRASAPWRDPRRIAPPPLSPPTGASPMACQGAAAAELPWGRRRVHRVRRARAAGSRSRSRSSNGRKHAAPLSGTPRHTEAIRGHQWSSSGSSALHLESQKRRQRRSKDRDQLTDGRCHRCLRGRELEHARMEIGRDGVQG
jgi:hypothetical protein